MPRQNEWVNEIWISDKTRFGHHFTRSDDRLQQPQMRTGGTLRDSNWEAALAAVAATLKGADGDVAAIAGSGMSNEDLWALRQLVAGVGGARLGAWPPTHGGAAAVAQVGLGAGSNLSQLGRGDAMLVIACDLEEEVPIWRLRLKQAQDRGAYLVVANARDTRLEDFALQGARNDRVVQGDAIRYGAGEAASLMRDLAQRHPAIAERLAGADNLVIVAGAEGLDLAGSQALAAAAANFLIESNHVGRANNGLLSPLPGANGMGLHYLGFTPQATLDIRSQPPRALIVAQADLLDDDPAAQEWLSQVETIVYAGLFDDGISQLADYMLPLQSFAERDGSFVNGERRVQRFYTAQGPLGQALPAWKLFGGISQSAGISSLKPSAAALMLELSQSLDAFAGMTHQALGKTERQFPDVGGRDLYYGGTAYENQGGVGLQIASAADRGEALQTTEVADAAGHVAGDGELFIMPITRLYNRQRAFRPSLLMAPRILAPYALLHPDDAAARGIVQGDVIDILAGGAKVRVRATVSDEVSAGVVALPRHLVDEAAPLMPSAGTISRIAEAAAVR